VTYTFNDGVVTAGFGADSANWSYKDGVLSVHTAKGGELQLNMESGEYNYVPPQSVVTADPERIDFILVDADGDTSGAKLTIDLSAIQITAPVVLVGEVEDTTLANEIGLVTQANLGIAVGAETAGAEVA